MLVKGLPQHDFIHIKYIKQLINIFDELVIPHALVYL